MRITGVATTLVVLACTSLSWVGCSSDTCIDHGNCEDLDGGPGSDGPSSDAPGIDAPPGCDLTKPVKDSPACIDDAVGVFVSASGDDGATGKKAAPVKTIGKGLELAAASSLPRVYVCEGSYGTAAEIKTSVAVYGGLSCAWAYTGNKPKLAPPRDIALRVTNVSGPVLVQDMEIDGTADTNTPGDSAIAAFVSQSTNVTFENITLSASTGTEGASPAGGSNYSVAAKQGVNSADGGTAVMCGCADGTSSTGGKGGAIGADGDPGTAMPVVGSANGGLGGGICNPGTIGADGQSGPVGTAGARTGSLTSSGWKTSPIGTSTSNGNPGQGGGGGGGRVGLGGGGGGGCGGCGGAGGGTGGGGGSSFALLSFESVVNVEGGALTTAAAGSGGRGADGQSGQAGGSVGTGACNGGSGGNGAGGSGGGGGAGGHSVPVGFIGTEPKVTGATLTPGAKGGGGGGGARGVGPGNAGVAGPVGPEGKAQNSLAL